jgi:hypothetical protein
MELMMPSEPVKIAEIDAEDGQTIDEIDALLDKAADEVLGKQGTGEASDDTEGDEPDDTEEAAEQVETSEFTELAPDEMALVESSNLTPREVQNLQRMPKAARQIALEFITSRGVESGRGGVRQEGADATAPSTQVDISQVLPALIRPLSKDVLTRFAGSLPGVEESVVNAFAEEVQKASVEPIAKFAIGLVGLIKETEKRQTEQEWARTSRFIRANLAEQYEDLKKEPVYNALVNNPATKRLVSAYQEQGLDLSLAIEKAITDRAASEYGNVKSSKRPDTKTVARQRSLRGTPEPGERTRQGTPKPTKSFHQNDLETALDEAFDLVMGRKK